MRAAAAPSHVTQAPAQQAAASALAHATDITVAPVPERDRRARDDEPQDAAPCSTCAPRIAHDFGRVPVHERSAPAVQPKLFVGAPGDRFEREADAMAEHVMRQPEERAASAARLPCASCAASEDEPIQRQPESPYSIDDGVVTTLEGEPEQGAGAPVQAKLAAGAAGGASVVTPAVAGGIQALRGSGAPLSTPLRAFMESRFGHDFGQVRVHTGSAAHAAAGRIRARAFTIGRDIVFADGQYAAGSDAGKRLLAHELTHVVQQGHAPRRSPDAASARSNGSVPDAARAPVQVGSADLESGVVRRVVWEPNKPTGKSSAPWGPGNPTGKVLTGKTDAGTSIDIWRPDDGKTYWCHGYTFGGSTAKGGPYSLWGSDVNTVLKDDGWQQTYSCMARPSDILVFVDAAGQVTHSGIIRKVTAPGAKIDEAKSMLESKWGYGPHNTDTWAVNAKGYGRYRCYSKTPLTGVCSDTGANER